MRNRAKCRLCNSIIESLTKNDSVTCKCGHISIDGGNEYYGAYAVNFANFLRVDDAGNEIPVEYKKIEDIKVVQEEPPQKMSRSELISLLEETLKSMDRLPDHAMYNFVTNADFYSFGLLVLSILRADS